MFDLNLNKTVPAVTGDIRDTNTTSFENDVLRASVQRPVIVEFWAPWCGPCKQLMPILERNVTAAGGAVAMAKVNIDENPELAQALRIQSVPTVFAFFQGQPVDGFMGARPESEIKAFIEKLKALGGQPAGAPDAETIKKLMTEADGFFRDGDIAQAMEKYSLVFDHDAENPQAMAGIAWCLFMQGDVDSVREMLAQATDAQQDARLKGLGFLLSLGGDAQALRARVEKDANDHAARFDLARALAGAGDLEGAIGHTIEIIKRKRDWNDEAARKFLLELFDAMGPQHPLTAQGRRQLSAILFS